MMEPGDHAADDKTYDVVVVGSFIVDLVVYSDRLPRPGESLIGNSFKKGFGGKGANQAAMSHNLGARTAMVGCVGDDDFGKEYKDHFRSEGIDMLLRKPPPNASTGVAVITVRPDGENYIIVVIGANEALSRDDIMTTGTDMCQAIQKARVVVCQLEVSYPAVEAALALGRRCGAVTVLNTAPMPQDVSKVPESLLKLADIVCCNEVEAAALCRQPADEAMPILEMADKCLNILHDLGCPRPMITLGSEGVVFKDEANRKQFVPVTKVDVVDTTGAGDCFVGSLAHYLAQGVCKGVDPLHSSWLVEAVRKSSQLATMSVTKPGTQASYPRGDAVPTELRQ